MAQNDKYKHILQYKPNWRELEDDNVLGSSHHPKSMSEVKSCSGKSWSVLIGGSGTINSSIETSVAPSSAWGEAILGSSLHDASCIPGGACISCLRRLLDIPLSYDGI